MTSGAVDWQTVFLVFSVIVGVWGLRSLGLHWPNFINLATTSRETELLARIQQLETQQTFLWEEIGRLHAQIDAKATNSKAAPAKRAPSVLLIAPKSNLPLVDAETQDILRSGLIVTPIFSPVTQVTLTREIRASHDDGLWFAGHMDGLGNFQLDNGELLPSSAITALVRGRFSWVYLNTCDSVIAAQNLQNETDADIICTIVSVPDLDAYRTGSLLANALARNGDLRAAYEQSRPGNNRIFLFLAGGKH